MRKKIALIIAALILNLSIITLYCVPVNAMPMNPIADGLYETFSRIFGYALGTYKETNELGYNYQMSEIQDFLEHQVLGEPYYWEDDETKVIQDINTYEGFLTLMKAGLTVLEGYNQGTVTSDYLDALNKVSYTSSGTMASATLEEKIANGIALVNTMGKVQFETNFENFRNTLFGPDEEGGTVAVSNLGTNYKLYEALMGSLMTMSEYDSTNEYFTPVDSTVYDYDSLNNNNFILNNVTYYYSFTQSFWSNVGTINSSGPLYYFVLKYIDTNATMIVAISEEYFWWRKDNVGNTYANEVTRNDKNFYYSYGQFGITDCSIPVNLIHSATLNNTVNELLDYFSVNILGGKYEAEKIAAVGGATPGLKAALDAFLNKDLTADDMVDLSDDLAAVDSSIGTEQAIQTLTDIINGLTVTLPASIVDGKNDVVTAVDGLGEIILTLPKAIWKEFAGVLEDIQSKVGTQAQTKPWEGDVNDDSPDILPIFNVLIILLQIIIALLRIFIHCLQFIINIFAIPPSSAMLPEEMVMGLQYINTIEIPGLGMSVYSFMMGLVYILIVFTAIRILRVNVDRIKIPKKLNGGL